MIAINIKGDIFLCDMEPVVVDQIRLSIMAARECGFGALEELASGFSMRVLYMRGIGAILQMGWSELMLLMSIMVYIGSEELAEFNARIIHIILEFLTSAMETAISS